MKSHNSRWQFGESSVAVDVLNDDQGIGKCVNDKAQNSSFLKVKSLVFVRITDACRLGGLVFIIFGLVGFGTFSIAIGIINSHQCPLQKYIPVYLIAEGALMLVVLPHVVLTSGSRPRLYTEFISFLYKAILSSFEICILVLGTVATYSVFPPNFDPSAGPSCSKVCFLAAFFLVTVTWCFIVAFIIFGALMICCQMSNAASRDDFAVPPL